MNGPNSVSDQQRVALKRAAAEAAVQLVEQGMIVGLGTGSTAAFAIEALARCYREGLRFVGIPTSQRTAAQATAAGIPLTSFAEHLQIDLTIDGADEVERGTLNLIKGLGGALLHEKIAAIPPLAFRGVLAAPTRARCGSGRSALSAGCHAISNTRGPRATSGVPNGR
jgi:ribose 5-phosphate isomerase A